MGNIDYRRATCSDPIKTDVTESFLYLKDFLKIQDMNIKYNILSFFAALTIVTACKNDDDIDRVYTVGEADNAIVLKVGVREGSGTQIATRGEVDGNHGATDKTEGSNVYGGGHTPFSSIGATGTQLALRIDGQWHNSVVSHPTAVTLGTADNKKHNPIATMSPTVFWDDYGTADPDNTDGRAAGLTIYGMGVDGVTTAPTVNTTDGTSWTKYNWNVGDPGTSATIDQNDADYWKNQDLLTSNNIHAEVSGKDYDGTYKFDDYIFDKTAAADAKKSSNILEFTHAMTKVTVQLTAGDGFPGYSATSTDAGKFEANDTYGEPTVMLENFYYTGSVSVEAKTSMPTTTSTANIQMHRIATAKNKHTVTFDALVFPGNSFLGTDEILTLTADGNTYKVTAAELNKAIQNAITNKATTKYPGTDNTLLQAWNYLIKIRVNKTDIIVTATILDWKTVEAAEEKTEIDIDEIYGHEGTAFMHDFDFFRSTAKASGYTNDAYVAYNTDGSYTFHNQLYWPDHQTHYFFRGVYPRVQTESQAGWILASNVSSSTSSATTIAVENSKYQEGTYPSDLALGWPDAAAGWPTSNTESDFDETCKVHTDKEGICATEGQIRMNFKYVMSKVQFSLTSSGTASLGNVVDLNHVKVEIIDGYTQGRIRLSDGLHEEYALEDKGVYPLTVAYTPAGQYKATTLDAIVPQELSDDVLVRISILDSYDNVLDVYEAQLNKIKVKTDNNTGALITEWLPGNYYKYYLDINKTAINVTATLTDWVTVEARDEVWF